MMDQEISSKLKEINAEFLDNPENRNIIKNSPNFFKNFQRGFAILLAAGIHEKYGIFLITNIQYSLELAQALAKFHQLKLLVVYQDLLLHNPQHAMELYISVERLNDPRLAQYVASTLTMPFGQMAQYAGALKTLLDANLLDTHFYFVDTKPEFAMDLADALIYLARHRLERYNSLIFEDAENSSQTKSCIRVLSALGLLDLTHIKKLKNLKGVAWQEFHNMLETLSDALKAIQGQKRLSPEIFDTLLANPCICQTIMLIHTVNVYLLNPKDLADIAKLSKIQARHLHVGISMLSRIHSTSITRQHFLNLMQLTNTTEAVALKKLSKDLDTIFKDHEFQNIEHLIALMWNIETNGFEGLWPHIRSEVCDEVHKQLNLDSRLMSKENQQFQDFIEGIRFTPLETFGHLKIHLNEIFRQAKQLPDLFPDQSRPLINEIGTSSVKSLVLTSFSCDCHPRNLVIPVVDKPVNMLNQS